MLTYVLSALLIYINIFPWITWNYISSFKYSIRTDCRINRKQERERETVGKSPRTVGDRRFDTLSCRFGVISIQTITSCIRGLLGTVYRYLGQSHVLGEAKKALSPKRTIPPVSSNPTTSSPSLVEMSEILFMDLRRLRNERFSSRDR